MIVFKAFGEIIRVKNRRQICSLEEATCAVGTNWVAVQSPEAQI